MKFSFIFTILTAILNTWPRINIGNVVCSYSTSSNAWAFLCPYTNKVPTIKV